MAKAKSPEYFKKELDKLLEKNNDYDFHLYRTPVMERVVLERITDECYHKLVVGRELHGDAWLGKDNLQETKEELLDSINYMMFHREIVKSGLQTKYKEAALESVESLIRGLVDGLKELEEVIEAKSLHHFDK